MKGLSGQNRKKPILFWSCVYLPYAWVFFSSLHLPVYLFPAGVLIALLYLGMCYQLWYIPAFLLGLFLVNQLVKRLGMVWTGGDHLSSILLGFDRDLFSLSGHHESSQGIPTLQQLIFHSAKWSLLHACFYLYGLLSL